MRIRTAGSDGAETDLAEKHTIANRLLMAILVISFSITLIVACLQLWFDYGQDVEFIEQRIHEIWKSNSESLTESVWRLDMRQLKFILEGILKVSDIILVEIEFEDGKRISKGTKSKRYIHRQFPIEHTGGQSGSIYLGRLHVVGDLEAVYARVYRKLPIILGIEAGRTFLISLIILFVVRHLILVHLLTIADYIRDPEANAGPLVLRRKLRKKGTDELDLVTTAVSDLAKAKQEAESASKAKTEFLANMSHEIRTPMNGVIGMLEILKTSELSIEQRSYVETVFTSAEALLGIIDDILDFSKIEAGRLELNPGPFDMMRMVEDMGQLLASRAEEKGIDLIVRYAPNTPRYFWGDSVRIRQILLNLAGNAVKFTEHGHVLIDVHCHESDHEKAALHIRIEDTGIGISEKDLKPIFEKFTQSDSGSTRKFGGTGLGLAISSQLVSMMGGNINVESVPGRGSVFDFGLSLPLSRQETGTAVSRADLSGILHLVVDDNAVNRRILSEWLKTWDIPHKQAESGREALDLMRRAASGNTPFRIAILDFHMPEMDGGTLAKAIKQERELKDTVLLMLTSAGGKIDTDMIDELGVSVCLSKPVRASELANALDAAWTSSRTGNAPQAAISPAGSNHRKTDSVSSEGYCNAKVLLAEDNPINRKVAMTALNRFGCTVDTAENGREAVRKVKERAYDIVFMDCRMPEVDGLEATRMIREYEMRRQSRNPETRKRLPVVAMTANATKNDMEECIVGGMDDFIAKPFRMERIREVLANFCGLRERPIEKIIAKVLIIEENPDDIETIRQAVRSVSQTAAIKHTACGVEGCALIGSFLPDLLILNSSANGIDCERLIQLLGGNARYSEIGLLVTADSENDFYRQSKIDTAIRKPLNKKELAAAMNKIFEKKTETSPFKAVPEKENRKSLQPREFNDSPVLERDRLDETLAGDLEMIREFIGIFVDEIPEIISQLEEAIDKSDMECAEDIAHKLKGAAGDAGGIRLYQVSLEIEQVAREGNSENCKKFMRFVHNEFDSLKKALFEFGGMDGAR